MRWLSLALLVACSDPSTSTSAGGSTGGEESSGSDAGTSGPPPTSSTTIVPDTGTTSAGSSSSTGEPELPPPPLSWIEDCVVAGVDLKDYHPDLQCTSIDVPLDWEDPEGEEILVAALRVPTTQDTARGALWMLDGGPGGSGVGYLFAIDFIEAVRDAGWDIIIPNHRGTLSPYLGCVSVSTYSADCRAELDKEWGDGLQHFNTVAAARDVGELVRRSQDDATIVMGISYGTYWAEYYAALFPDQPDGVVLDSIVPTDADLAAEEFLVQDRAVALLQACVDDPTCGPRVGFASGEEFSDAVISAIDDGDCGTGDPGLWEDAQFRYDFGVVINATGARNMFPLIAALLTRCDPDLTDIARGAIASAFATTPLRQFPLGGVQNEFFSGPLQAVVLGTTIIAPDADPEPAALAAERHLATLGFGTLEVNAKEFFGDLPNVAFDHDFVAEPPLLLLNATYDLQTVLPWAQQVSDQHGVPLLEFPDSSHGVSTAGAGTCAQQILLDFAALPTEPPDLSCMDDLPQIDVNLEREDLQPMVQNAFGTDDPWSLLPPL